MERLWLLIAIVLAYSSMVPSLEARAQAPVEFAGIDTLGTCTNADGGFDFELTVPSFAPGQEVGSSANIPTARSFSLIPVSLDELSAGEASVVLTDGNDIILACGTIGGKTELDGRVAFGIGEVNDSGISGIGVLTPGPDTTQAGIAIYLVGLEPPMDGQPVATPAPAQATPEASPVANGISASAMLT